MKTIDQVIEYLSNRIEANEQAMYHLRVDLLEDENANFQEVLDFIHREKS